MMSVRGRRIVGALGLIIALIVITLLGLHFHIRTIAINSDVSYLKRELRLLKRQNRRMQIRFFESSSLREVEARAKAMGLKPTTRIRYLTHDPIKTAAPQ